MKTLALLVLWAALAQAVPVINRDSGRCAQRCSGYTKYKYSPGTTHVFDYRAMTTTEVKGASEQSAKLMLSAIAEIEVYSTCEFGLSLSGVRLSHTDGSGRMKTSDRESSFKQNLEKSVLRFSFDDGVIHHICPTQNDPAWVTNIKRGVLSAFQNGMLDWNKDENRTETDLAGVCKTRYIAYSPGYFTSFVRREKDMLSCTQRNNLQAIYHVAGYNIESDLQTLPLMKTTQVCDISVKTKGLLSEAICKEMHVYRPFSNGDNGASTTVDQSLTYNGERQGVRTQLTVVTTRSNLLFEHVTVTPEPGQAMEMAQSKLIELCATTPEDVRPETPQKFSELVSSVRFLSHTNLDTLYRKLRTKGICAQNARGMKFFMDALPMASTSASIRMMSTLMGQDEVQGHKAKAWLTTLAFIHKPTTDMLREAMAMLSDSNSRQDAMLPVSSMVYNFCKNRAGTSSGNCEDVPEIDAVVASMMKGHSKQCDTRRNLGEILLLLRSFGNTGYPTKTIEVINKCMTSRYTALEARVAAAQAFRRMPCNADNSMLWTTLSDNTLDSELRIAAYLSLMRCPHENLQRIVSFLNNEQQDSHVGTFIYSHLTNLQESSNPHNQDVAEAISRLKIEKEFDNDPSKTSTNLEKSVLINKLNSGFTSDTNVVWSNKAQKIHSISSNLSVELFGNSINLLDVGARLEGFKHLARSIVYGSKVSSQNRQTFQMSMYGRVFGNEIMFQHHKMAALPNPFDKTDKWMDALIKLADVNEFAHTQSLQLLDSGVTVPTALGFPLTLCVNGSAVLDIAVKGKLDVRKLAAEPRSLTVDGEISPSAAIEVNGVMAVDAYGMAQTALRMRNMMHTSTGVKGRIHLDRGQQFNMDVDLPRDKTEVFEARSEFLLTHNNENEKSLKMITENRKEFKFSTGQMVSKVTGMELSGEVSYPNASLQYGGPYFPFTGPASVKVVMNKKDTQTGYKLFVKRIERSKSSIAQIMLNTPGSRIDRKMLLDVAVDYPRKEVDVKAISPWKKATFKGNLVNTESRKALSGFLVLDEKSNYGLVSEVKITDSDRSTTLVPKLEIRKPGSTPVVLSGIVNYDTAYNGIDSALTLSGIRKEPYLFNGKLRNTDREKTVSLSFTPPDSKKDYAFESENMFTDLGKGISVNSKLNVRTPVRSLASASVVMSHREDKMLKMNANLEIYRICRRSTMTVSISKVVKNGNTRFNYDSKVKSPKLTGRIQGYTSVKGLKMVASKFTLDYTIPRRDQNKILMDLKFNDRSTSAYTKYDVKSIVNFRDTPEYNLGLEAAFDFKKRVASSTIEVKYGPSLRDKNKSITLSSSLKKNVRNWKNANVNYKLKAEAPEFNVDVMLEGNHAHTPKLLDSTFQMDYASGKTVKMGINLKDQTNKRRNLNGVTFIILPGSEYTLSSSLIENSPTQMTHSILLVDKRGAKNQMVTVISNPKNKPRTLESDIKLDGMKAMSMSGSANLDPKNFNLDGMLKHAKDVYSMSTSGKYAPNINRGKLAFELLYPSRKITMAVEGGGNNGETRHYNGKMELDWDANRKMMKSKLNAEFNHLYKMSDDAKSLTTMFHVKTPFKRFENVGSSFKYLSNSKQSDIKAKLTPGSKAKEISMTLNTMHPLSIYNAVATVTAKSPFRGLQQVEVNINHKLDSTLSSVLKTILEKHTAELVLNGENSGDSYRTDLKGNMAFKSNLPNLEFVNLVVSHNGNSRKYKTSSVLTHNRDKYTYDMNVDHYKRGWNLQNIGDIVIVMPRRRFSTTWKHKNTEKTIDSSIASVWDNKVLDLKLNGLMEDGPVKSLDTTLLIQSPWEAVRNANFKMNGNFGNGVWNGKASWLRNGQREASSEVSFTRKRRTVSLDTKITSPYHKDITGQIDLNYQNYPWTGTALVQWSPRNKVTMAGSAAVKAWDDAELDMKVTTPLSKYKNVVWKASSKKENNENVLSANIDTGVRQWMNVESRFRMDEAVKMAKFKLKSSHQDLKTINTGFRLDGKSLSDFTSNVEFEADPYIDKMSLMFVLKNQDTFTSNVYIFTPFPVMPSLEASVTYEKAVSQHITRLQLKYPAKITGAIEMSLKTDLPMTFSTKITSDNPKYNNIGVSLQHDHSDKKINSHAEVIYKPGQKIEADVIGAWLVESRRYGLIPFTVSNAEGSIMVRSPFRDYRLSKTALRHKLGSGSLDSHFEYTVGKHKMEVDGSYVSSSSSGTFAVISSIPGAEKIRWTFKKRGGLWNMKLESLWIRNDERASVVIMNRYIRNSLTSSLVLTSSFMETMKAQIEHKKSSDYNNLEEKVIVSYGRVLNFNGEASYAVTGTNFIGKTLVRYKQGRIQEAVGLSVSKTGRIQDFSVDATANRNSDVVTAKGSWKYGNTIDANLDVTTPFKNYRKLNMKFSHEGSIDDFKAGSSLTYMDGQTVSGKVDFAHGNGKRINLITEAHTPGTDVSLTVTNSINSRANQGDIKGSMELITSIDRFRFGKLTYQVVGTIDNFVADAIVVKNQDQVISFKAVTNSLPRDRSFKTTMDLRGSMIKDSTFVFEKVGDPEYLLNPIFSGNVKMSVMGTVDQKQVAVKTEITKRGTISRGMFETKVEVVTPVQDFESTKFSYKHTGRSKGFVCVSTLDYSNGKKINYELQAMSSPSPKYTITMTTPYANYDQLKYEMTYDLTGPAYSLTSNVNAGNGNVFSLTGNLDTEREIKGNVAVSTPFEDYTDLSASMSHKGNTFNFNSDFSVVYMKSKNINGKVRFSRDWKWNMINLNAELNTPYRNMPKTAVIINHKHDRRNSKSQVASSGSVEYGSRQVIEGKMELNYDPDFDFKLDVKSPFKDFRAVKIVSKAEDMSLESFKAMGSVLLNRRDTYTSNIKWNVNSWKMASGFVNVYTTSFGMNEIKYSHEINSRKIDAVASVEYDEGKMIKAEIKTILDPVKKLNLMIKTPFTGFEDMKADLMFSESYRKYVTENSVDLGQGRIYVFKSDVDYSSTLKSFTANLISPIPEIKSVDLKMRHEGPVHDFTTYVYFYLPLTDVVEAKTTVVYNGIFDASFGASLQSAMPNVDDLKLDFKTSELAGEKKMTTALQWTEGKMILSNLFYRQQSTQWNDHKYRTDFTLTTPFSQVQNVMVNLEQGVKTKAFDTKVVATLNGEQLCDMDLSLGYENDEPRVEVNVRRPRSMQLKATTSLKDDQKEAGLYVNWDRDDADSNINIKASQSVTSSEKGFAVDITHPSRTVGLSQKMLTVRGVDTYEGQVYWNSDDDSRLMYTVEVKDSDGSRGRRRPGSRTIKELLVKLGLPRRTISMLGTYSGQGTSHSVDTTFSWDADNDASKMMKVTATLSGSDKKKGEITIGLPTMNKELKFGGELTMTSGRTIWDARTDFSYSKDSRKTLTLTSKIEDIKDYKSDFNYSLTLGLSHPYTQVDIQMSSHFGQSKDKASLGAKTMYMTARKQTKNLALFAEIDKIKKTLNVQVFNPVTPMAMSGGVVSERPYKVQMESDLMKWDVTLDSINKAVLMNTYYNQDGIVTMSAMYPNTTSVKATVTKHKPLQQNKEVLLDLNLLTPRLLHVSLKWRPGMIKDLSDYNLRKFRMRSDELLKRWKDISTEIIDEMSAKYNTIVNAVSEEVRPVLEDLNKELLERDRQIQKLLKSLDELYRNNEVYNVAGDIGQDIYVMLRNVIAQFGKDYKRLFTKFMRTSFDTLDEWKRYDLKSAYTYSLEERNDRYKDFLGNVAQGWEDSMNDLDSKIEEMEEARNEIVEQVKSNPYVKEFSNRINQIQSMDITDMDVTPYIPDVDLTYYPTSLASWSMNKMPRVDLTPLTNSPVVKYAHKGVNEVYQQGLWAYRYWQIKKNIKEHTLSLLRHLQLIAGDEMKEYMKSFHSYSKNPVTAWRPERGVMEVDIPLPLPVDRLDELPKWGPYFETVDFSMMKEAFKDMQEYVVDTFSPSSSPNTSGWLPDTYRRVNVARPTYRPQSPYSPNRRYSYNNRRRGGRRPYSSKRQYRQ